MAALSARDRETASLVALLRVKGIGPGSVRDLLVEHGSGVAALAAVGGRTQLPAARRALGEVRALGGRAVAIGERAYPEPLLDLADPPPVLYVRGDGWPDPDRTVAVVGTRRSTPYGRRITSRLARDLARWGWTVVSGMAAGIDARAHEAALDAGGLTIGVLGTGLGREYPASNRPLYARMRRHGWLVSELEPGAGPTRSSFPRRNRLIAALARAVVVVEAGSRSGALGTARLALGLGREVLAAPARIDDRTGVGTLRLLRDGAHMVTDVRDVFDALGWIHDLAPPPERARPPVAAGPDGWVLTGLGGDARTAEEISTLCGRSIGDTLSALGRLEVDGRVGRSVGGRFHAREWPAGPSADATA